MNLGWGGGGDRRKKGLHPVQGRRRKKKKKKSGKIRAASHTKEKDKNRDSVQRPAESTQGVQRNWGQ